MFVILTPEQKVKAGMKFPVARRPSSIYTKPIEYEYSTCKAKLHNVSHFIKLQTQSVGHFIILSHFLSLNFISN